MSHCRKNLPCKNLPHRRHLRIDRPQRRQERAVDILCRDGLAIENERPRSARVARHPAGKAEIEGRPHRGIDAHVGHHAADDQLLDARFLERQEEPRVPEAVGEVLDDDRLPRLRRDQPVDLRAGRIRQEEG